MLVSSCCPAGYLLGYLIHRKTQVEPLACGNEPKADEHPEATAGPAHPEATAAPAEVAPLPGAQMDWGDVTQLLTEKLTTEALSKTLRYTAHVHTFLRSHIDTSER